MTVGNPSSSASHIKESAVEQVGWAGLEASHSQWERSGGEEGDPLHPNKVIM